MPEPTKELAELVIASMNTGRYRPLPKEAEDSVREICAEALAPDTGTETDA